MKEVGFKFMAAFALFVVASIMIHTMSNHHDGYFAPAASIDLPLDERASLEQSFPGRGGTLFTRVTSITDLGTVHGKHQALARLQIAFHIDGRYDGWGWSRLSRPTLYAFVIGARMTGEGARQHVTTVGDLKPFFPIPAPPGTTRYAPTLQETCSTDYQHTRCRFEASVPITGEMQFLQIQVREQFR